MHAYIHTYIQLHTYVHAHCKISGHTTCCGIWKKGEIQIGFAARGIRASLACDLEREHMKPPPRFRDSVRRAVPVELLELGGKENTQALTCSVTVLQKSNLSGMQAAACHPLKVQHND